MGLIIPDLAGNYPETLLALVPRLHITSKKKEVEHCQNEV
jgi:hypothetical protein